MATVEEGDEPAAPVADNSLGRLLALSDGIFAIAMTLLALDLRLPDLGAVEKVELERLWADMAVFVLCIPGAFALGGNGPWLLVLLVASGRVPLIRRAAA